MIWVKRIFWILFALTVLVVLVMSNQSNKKAVLQKPEILILVNGENAFLTEDELYTRLLRKGLVFSGQTFEQLNIPATEKFIREMTEVKDVKVFGNIGGKWNITIDIRKPIARIFNQFGESFYLDEDGVTMAPSYLYTARVVVVTGFIPDAKTSLPALEVAQKDSLKYDFFIDDIYYLSKFISENEFMQALIGQIYLAKNGDFILTPQVGEQTIIFGSAKSPEEVAEKFKKLEVFYQEAIPYEGWSTYESINLKFDNQIVTKRRKSE
jgi:cell division protein FtsQ